MEFVAKRDDLIAALIRIFFSEKDELKHLILSFLLVLTCTLVFSNTAFAAETILSPLKQIKSGIPIQDVKCKTELTLMIKSNGNPACVKHTSEQRFLAHGWTIPKFETMQTKDDKIPSITLPDQTSNAITNAVVQNMTQNVMPVLNGTSDVTSTNDLENTINATTLNKWYDDNYAGIEIPQVAFFQRNPLPALQVEPIISSTDPDTIKILMIGMSPNPLKVGNTLEFTVIWQNISNKPIYVYQGAVASPIGMAIEPSTSVRAGFENQASDTWGPFTVEPDQMALNRVNPYYNIENLDLKNMRDAVFRYGVYQITEPGTLHVTMKLFLRDHGIGNEYDIMETIRFDVNVTQ